jgi:DNA-binding XRE family transcriptional regulator
MTPLERIRTEHNLNQQQLADKVGVCHTTIFRIECEGSMPKKKTLAKIIDVFGGKISADEIIFPERYSK